MQLLAWLHVGELILFAVAVLFYQGLVGACTCAPFACQMTHLLGARHLAGPSVLSFTPKAPTARFIAGNEHQPGYVGAVVVDFALY